MHHYRLSSGILVTVTLDTSYTGSIIHHLLITTTLSVTFICNNPYISSCHLIIIVKCIDNIKAQGSSGFIANCILNYHLVPIYSICICPPIIESLLTWQFLSDYTKQLYFVHRKVAIIHILFVGHINT